MNKTLHQLAYQNVKRYKKHYIFTFIAVALLSTFFISYIRINYQYYEANKRYEQSVYGTWYEKLTFHAEDFHAYDSIISQHINSPAKYGYSYEYGPIKNGQAAYLDNNVYELGQLTLSEGRFPQQDNEMMVAHSFIDDKGWHLNQTITINEPHLPKQLKIVGIIECSQPDVFPDIFLFKSYSPNTISVYMEKELGWTVDAPLIDRVINSFGYPSNNAITQMQIINDRIAVVCQMIIIADFVLYALCSSTYQKRTKELTLLRSIGMTKKQMVIMMFYEILPLSFIAIIIGALLSLGVTYISAYYIENQFHEFIYILFDTDLLYDIICLQLLVFIILLYPIYSSSRHLLAGTFDDVQHRYIQIRYRQLKYQTKWRLAIREVKTQKPISRSLYILSFVISAYLIGSLVAQKLNDTIQYYEFDIPFTDFQTLSLRVNTLEEAQDYASLIPNSQIYHNQYLSYYASFEIPDDHSFIIDDIIILDDLSWLNHCKIKGRLPQNDHEILMGFEKELYEDIHLDTDYTKKIQIGDTIYVNDQTYQVVGSICPNEIYNDNNYIYQDYYLYYLPTAMFYVLPDTAIQWQLQDREDFESYQVTFYAKNTEQRLAYKEIIRNYLNTHRIRNNIIDPQHIIGSIIHYQEMPLLVDIPVSYLIAPIIITFVFCYFDVQNQIITQKNDYILYHLIGMTKSDIKWKQFNKALYMTMVFGIIELLWLIIYCAYYQIIICPFVEIFISLLCVGFLLTIIYCLPLYFVLHDHFTLPEIKE